MFVLEFHRSVARIMEWTKDAPPSIFLSVHQTVMEKKNPSAETGVCLENVVFRAYILHDYPGYFGTSITVGKKTAKNIDKIMQLQN
jgi:hypothetical protein